GYDRMKKVYFPQHGGNRTEQNLVQDLVDEQIKLFGADVFYIPRVSLKDKALGEVIQSEFNQSYMIEMMLVNVEGFGAGSEFVSKFGLRITDEITFVVSRRRWEQSANPALNLSVDGRPKISTKSSMLSENNHSSNLANSIFIFLLLRSTSKEQTSLTQELTTLTILKESSATSPRLTLVLLPDSKLLEQLQLMWVVKSLEQQ
ncbi:MAG: hypothetical protein VW270_24640, partial [Candidatus Poseidoniales archaeon]